MSSSNSDNRINSFQAQSIIKEFTLGAANAVYPDGKQRPMIFPDRPSLATSDRSKFISKMVMSELLELLLTIEPSVDNVKEMMHNIVDDLDLPTSAIPCIKDSNNCDDTKSNSCDDTKSNNSNNSDNSKSSNIENIPVIEAQMDAVADIMYYLYDFSTRQGYNIDRILSLVHGANMAKRHEDDLFHKRDDGKVMKPIGWKEADLQSEVIRQLEHGAWS